MKRSPAPKRRKSIARGGPLPQVSPKRAAEADERKAVRQATFARDGYRCVARLFVPGVSCDDGLECDERHGRGRRPGSHLDLSETQTLCRACHHVKTTSPKVAGLLGLFGLDVRARELHGDVAPEVTLRDAYREFARRKAMARGVTWRDQIVDGRAVEAFVQRRAAEALAAREQEQTDG